MEKVANKRTRSFEAGLLLAIAMACLTSFASIAQEQRPILQRRITVHAENVRLQTALSLIAKDGGFKLSYNAAIVPSDSIVTVHAENEKVDVVLQRTLPAGSDRKESGGHLIITGKSRRKQRFTARGHVLDAFNGDPITSASVVDVKRRNAVETASNGGFEIALAGDLESTPLLFSRRGYRDTVIFVARDAHIGQVRLRPADRMERLEPICLQDRCGVEDLGLARLLVPAGQMQQTTNLAYAEKSDWQLAVIPSISTNGRISGSVVNRFSFNVIGGYSRGVEGFELGGAMNMVSDDVNGLQIAGATNLVGGHTRGAQIAGGVNHTMRSSEGLQLAGAGNVVWDTLAGVQVAGGVNIVKREMTGTQIAGATNIALQDLDGVQVAGGVNVTHGAVNKAQIAGGMNYARAVTGGQVAGGMNVSLGDVGGGQVSGGANFARSVSGGQVSLGMNIVPGEVSGGQVGLGLNYAHSVTGGQVSLGANIVPGDVEAGQVGFGLNYAANVIGGQFTFGANIVPGTIQGAQVGTFNFGGNVKGGQFGIVNISDSLGGAAVGILSIALNGYHRFDVMTNDVFPLSLQLRTGTRGFHNILGWSAPVTADERWGFLYGLGTEARLSERLHLNIDLTGEQVMEQREWMNAVNILGRLGANLGYLFADRIHIGAGPVMNVLATDWRDPDSGTYLSTIAAGDPFLERTSGDMKLIAWWGWRVSAGLRFWSIRS